jgi:hypothetical protein
MFGLFSLLLNKYKIKNMKTKLLLALFLPLIGFAQASISSYYGTNGIQFSILNPTGISHTPTGANTSWNFTNLSEIGESIDTETTPTASELSDFPGTTNVVKTTSSIDGVASEFNIYSKHPGNVLSLTGIQNTGLLLNYITNNATLGLFPMEYGFANTDNIAGNYDNGDYAGTFTGTITTNVNAWGTLTIAGTADITPFSGAVTRLKTVQNISLNYGIFSNIGTAVVTTYSYYGTTLPTGIPHFRTTITNINVPLLNINQTLAQHEAFKGAPLKTTASQLLANQIVIAPNPVQNILNLKSANNQEILSVVVTDLLGKTVINVSHQSNDIDVSHLQKGIYFAKIETDLGSSVKKFIKK